MPNSCSKELEQPANDKRSSSLTTCKPNLNTYETNSVNGYATPSSIWSLHHKLVYHITRLCPKSLHPTNHLHNKHSPNTFTLHISLPWPKQDNHPPYTPTLTYWEHNINMNAGVNPINCTCQHHIVQTLYGETVATQTTNQFWKKSSNTILKQHKSSTTCAHTLTNTHTH